MKIDLPEETVRRVEAILARREGGDVATFIDQTVRRAVFFANARALGAGFADVPEAELQRLIDDEVDAVRSRR